MEGSNIRTPWINRIGYFGHILILVGMVFFFGAVGVFLSNWICVQLWQVDVTQLNLAGAETGNPQVLNALRLYQTLGGGIGMFLVPALLFPRAIQYDVNSLIYYKFKPQAWHLLAAVVLVIISVPMVSWSYQINQHMRFPESFSELEQQIRSMEESTARLTKLFVTAHNIPELLLTLFVVALVPAICEEFFFRGIVLNYTRFVFHAEWVAVFVSALVFSGFHGQFYGFLPRFLMGIFLGVLYLKTASIWTVVLAHFLNNGLAVISVYFSGSLSSVEIFDENYTFGAFWVILSVAATVLLLYTLSEMNYYRSYQHWRRNSLFNRFNKPE